MRVALLVEYDGTDFHGSQLQASDRTVQEELERALKSLFQTAIRPKLASRTDAGVHAAGQVAAFDVETNLDMKTIRDALNHYLPHDVAVGSVHRVHRDFNPRRDATRREYIYTIHNAPMASPIHRRYEATVRGELDAGRMRRAAQHLVGSHDFASFGGPRVPGDASTERDMEAVSISRDGDRLRVWFKANAFMHQQIRRMTGALVAAGRAEEGVQQLRQLVNEAARGSCAELMPPQGLCLTRIHYPDSGTGALPA